MSAQALRSLDLDNGAYAMLITVFRRRHVAFIERLKMVP